MSDEAATPTDAKRVAVETDGTQAALEQRREEHRAGLAILRAHTESVTAIIKRKTATGADDGNRPL